MAVKKQQKKLEARREKIFELDELWWDLLLENIRDPDMRKSTQFMNVIRQVLEKQQLEFSEVPEDGPVRDLIKELEDRGLPVFHEGVRVSLN